MSEIQGFTGEADSSVHFYDAEAAAILSDMETMSLPNMRDMVMTGLQLRHGMAQYQRPLHVRPPIPGRYTTREGERLGVHELLPLVDEWIAETEGSVRFVVQGGNRYISHYLQNSQIDAQDMKVMSMNKAPLYVQLSTLLTPAERQEMVDPGVLEELGIPAARTREEMLITAADYIVPSPFSSVTNDSNLETELASAVSLIDEGAIDIPHKEVLQKVLAGTQLAALLGTDKKLEYLDDLFYRGRTLHSLAVVVAAFGGNPQNIRLTSIACDQNSANLTSSYHRVLNNKKLYPFENSISTEQGYWQDVGTKYVFTDMADYWEYLNERVDYQKSVGVYALWQDKINTWFDTYVDPSIERDHSLINPLLWLRVYGEAFGIDLNVDKIVDQKGYRIGASVPFAQLIDRFISQEETVEARSGFKKQVADTLQAIQDAFEVAPDTLRDLTDFYMNNRIEIDYSGLNFMFDSGDTEFNNEEPSLEYATLITRLKDYISSASHALDRPNIVGINGVDTSGKSQLSHALSEALSREGIPVTIVHLDNFTRPLSERRKGDDRIDNYYNRTFDFDGLRRELLDPLVRGELPKTVLRHVDPRDDSAVVEHAYAIQPGPSVVLVEGVFIFRPELREYFDQRIFLDVPPDTMRERAIIRDVPKVGFQALKKYLEKYIPAQQRYLREAMPREVADVVIDNSNWAAPIVVKGLGKHGN